MNVHQPLALLLLLTSCAGLANAHAAHGTGGSKSSHKTTSSSATNPLNSLISGVLGNSLGHMSHLGSKGRLSGATSSLTKPKTLATPSLRTNPINSLVTGVLGTALGPFVNLGHAGHGGGALSGMTKHKTSSRSSQLSTNPINSLITGVLGSTLGHVSHLGPIGHMAEALSPVLSVFPGLGSKGGHSSHKSKGGMTSPFGGMMKSKLGHKGGHFGHLGHKGHKLSLLASLFSPQRQVRERTESSSRTITTLLAKLVKQNRDAIALNTITSAVKTRIMPVIINRLLRVKSIDEDDAKISARQIENKAVDFENILGLGDDFNDDDDDDDDDDDLFKIDDIRKEDGDETKKAVVLSDPKVTLKDIRTGGKKYSYGDIADNSITESGETSEDYSKTFEDKLYGPYEYVNDMFDDLFVDDFDDFYDDLFDDDGFDDVFSPKYAQYFDNTDRAINKKYGDFDDFFADYTDESDETMKQTESGGSISNSAIGTDTKRDAQADQFFDLSALLKAKEKKDTTQTAQDIDSLLATFNKD